MSLRTCQPPSGVFLETKIQKSNQKIKFPNPPYACWPHCTRSHHKSKIGSPWTTQLPLLPSYPTWLTRKTCLDCWSCSRLVRKSRNRPSKVNKQKQYITFRLKRIEERFMFTRRDTNIRWQCVTQVTAIRKE